MTTSVLACATSLLLAVSAPTQPAPSASRLPSAPTPSRAGQSLAPDFRQANPQGKLVQLSALRGQYVLLDFWASWCPPCRAENPVLVQAYQRYKGKKFTILSVSLDHNRAAWLKAVQADGLTWPQVSDLKGWDNAAAVRYHIEALPQNYLLDPTGHVVGQNLRGAALEQRLAQLLGS
ncbi:TlpA disulfide reductase family protein [Hymenobacter sp. BT559]|uniref:TlpA family protein disulfide reductase n=1 Tax=Hymenobacter sp. BT559 TaxID=2795729 RepID=UPI0018EC9E9C|nr:TlpA disulfide reductase family protein [Hymenobacter sp. BT559]MBJ6146351.1 TlpA family protein disulfide reductase [Hymenobacter sp. BT559]